MAQNIHFNTNNNKTIINSQDVKYYYKKALKEKNIKSISISLNGKTELSLFQTLYYIINNHPE